MASAPQRLFQRPEGSKVQPARLPKQVQKPNGPSPAGAHSGLRLFIEIERMARNAANARELHYICANELRKISGARQIFVFENRSNLHLTAISGLTQIDHNAPFVQDMQRALTERRDHAFTQRQTWSLAEASNGKDIAKYPFPQLLWVPFLSPKKHLAGGMLLVREQPWSDTDAAIPSRLGEVFAHALALLAASPKTSLSSIRHFFGRKRLALGLALFCMASLLIPVPMTALAPMEVVSEDPFIVAAPIDGVIDEILVDPGEEVVIGQPIVTFSDTVLRNELDIAQREIEIVEAQLKKASQQAFDDVEGRAHMRAAMSDLALKKAKYQYASEMLDRATIKAERAGIAVFSDKQSLIAKPVTIGERIMQVADPKNVQIQIQLAVDDALLLRPNAPIKLFLDGDPLHPRDAHLVFNDYQAHIATGEKLAFRVIADLNDNASNLPGIGVRGTAQVYGEQTLLGFYLFRRPLSALRQWIGL